LKIGERFGLQATQFELDFVDVDTDRDLALFVDPFLMGALKNTWALNASQTLRNFFQTFVTLIREEEAGAARTLFNYLHEPNETCLGLSRGKPRGNAIGDIDGEAYAGTRRGVRGDARAKIKVMVKRILNRYGYPPDLQEEAVKTVLAQAELLCADWTMPG
jgi:hypothetical protein